jgi:DNA-binding NarL/FixJ family response regulator
MLKGDIEELLIAQENASEIVWSSLVAQPELWQEHREVLQCLGPRRAVQGLDGAGCERNVSECMLNEIGLTLAQTGTVVLKGRPLEVLRLLDQGYSDKQIEASLGIKPPTIRSHIKIIFAALDAKSRTHAVARARERGIL